MSTIDTDRFRDTLLQERERVTAAIAHLHDEHPGTLADETGELVSGSADQHMGDMATATYDRELDYSLEENSEQVLGQIDAALKRIEDGTFGVCRTCGKQITQERLEAMPWADQCIEDKRREEGR
jgi:RNA polymerase-binding protein DksA